ncbi:MAG TPA: hypothetical protein VIV40_06330 [Kofleriaceae bacterium]
MRRPGLLLLAIAACSGDDSNQQVFEFGPFSVAAQEEVTTLCAQITLHNTETVYVNTVELTTGPGFHHSNWFFVPEHIFAGDDGVFTCKDRNFDIAAAAVTGGVFFAQSTQTEHEVQAFPAGMAIPLPPKTKLVAQLHLLNRGDDAVSLTPKIAITTLDEADVKTKLAGISMEYHPLSLPPRMRSRFTVDCDLGDLHQTNLGRPPDFNIYYTLAHYHQYGTKMELEAVTPDEQATTIYTTSNSIGDALGGQLKPAFNMAGNTRLRLTCEYYNNTDAMIWYGNGDGEMCVFLAFSDSAWLWGGGVLDQTPDPTSGVNDGGVMSFSRKCQLFTREAY